MNDFEYKTISLICQRWEKKYLPPPFSVAEYCSRWEKREGLEEQIKNIANKELDEISKAVFYMKIENKTTKEISNALGITLSSAEYFKVKALRKLSSPLNMRKLYYGTDYYESCIERERNKKEVDLNSEIYSTKLLELPLSLRIKNILVKAVVIKKNDLSAEEITLKDVYECVDTPFMIPRCSKHLSEIIINKFDEFGFNTVKWKNIYKEVKNSKIRKTTYQTRVEIGEFIYYLKSNYKYSDWIFPEIVYRKFWTERHNIDELLEDCNTIGIIKKYYVVNCPYCNNIINSPCENKQDIAKEEFAVCMKCGGEKILQPLKYSKVIYKANFNVKEKK